MALAMTAGSAAAAGPAFSPGWFADKRATQAQAAATGRLPGGGIAGIPNAQREQQRSQEQLQRSLVNLNRTAAMIAAQQSAQAAARQAALNGASAVPDGMAEGGLKVDRNPLTAELGERQGADRQVAGSGEWPYRRHGGTDRRARHPELGDLQRWPPDDGGLQTGSVLGGVESGERSKARPSQIQGQIDAAGTVMVVNRNGIVFSGTSQVNTRNPVAAAVGMSDAQFRQGIYSAKVDSGVQERMTPAFGNDLAGAGDAATFSKATGDVRVEAGARIQTASPSRLPRAAATCCSWAETHNAGQITTPGGQTLLAAGDSFIIRKGLASDANSISTTRGNEVSARRRADSEAGLVANTGLIQAPTGDVTLTGHDVRQLGVAVSSTTVTTRGTVHLLNSASDTGGKIVLGRDSATAILLEADGGRALDAQRDACCFRQARQTAIARRDRRSIILAPCRTGATSRASR